MDDHECGILVFAVFVGITVFAVASLYAVVLFAVDKVAFATLSSVFVSAVVRDLTV